MGIPCKDCITLGACKSQLLESDTYTLIDLRNKCTLLEAFIYIDRGKYSKQRIREVLDFLVDHKVWCQAVTKRHKVIKGTFI